MGVFSDVTEEFKKAGTKERTLIVLGVISVAAVAYYVYTRQQGQGTQAAPPLGAGNSSPQVAGYPLAGSTPVLPAGVNPLYDPNGNLVAFQNPTPSSPPPPPAQGGGMQHPENWYTNLLGLVGYSTTVRPGGYDTNGQRFWLGKTGNANLFYAPIGSSIAYGGQGRVWLKLPDGSQQLLTGPGQTTASNHTTVTQAAALQSH